MKLGLAWKRLLWLVLVCALWGAVPLQAAAADGDFTGVLEQIFSTGQSRGEITSLSFIDGDLHQYAVAEGYDAEHVTSLSFIEEDWSKQGDDDVIDQWIISVEPDPHAYHVRMVERNLEVISTEHLSTDGADAVVRRILEKIRQNGRRASVTPWSAPAAGE